MTERTLAEPNLRSRVSNASGNQPTVTLTILLQGSRHAKQLTWPDLYHHPDDFSTCWACTLASVLAPPASCPGGLSSTGQNRD